MSLVSVSSSRRRWLVRSIAAAACAVLLAGCNGVAGNATGTSTAAPSSDTNARIVASYGGIYSDPDLERTLALIVGRLVAASDDPSRSYRITILNSDSINAFALEEGYLYVTRGLLTLATDASEVAAVLAHEMAHITADHASQRRNQAQSAAIVTAVAAGAGGGGETATATSQQTLASFSQQQELEADAIGIRTIARAGYDPYAASRFLQAMVRFSAYRSGLDLRTAQSDFLASHPSNPDRIALAIATARQVAPEGGGEIDRERYLAGLDGTVFGDDATQGFVRGNAFYHPQLAIAFSVPDGFALDNSQTAVLAVGGDGTALRFDAIPLPGGQSLTEYLTSGWVNGLNEASIQGLTISGLAAVSATAAAGGWQFRITLVEVGNSVYRFIFANARDSIAFADAAAAIAGTFRQLSASEISGLAPMRLRILQVRPGDTPEAFAAAMAGVAQNPLDLFLVLNGFEPGTALVPGSTVKIVAF